ncbi:hypothetical protein H1Q59_04225 [Holosporaceae bacterium 'Namur']|nr:hypothetical protein [Holosporaceae bacterium 'Namur']
MKQGEMLSILVGVLSDMPTLLQNKCDWKSLNINDEFPNVDRIWRQIGNIRVNLHRIHTSKEKPLFHSHPWPSAMAILKGEYETAIGYGKEKPPIIYSGIFTTGTMYEMPDKDTWHYVMPFKEPCYTVMVTGLPWDISPSNRTLVPLTDDTFDEVYSFFQQYFCKSR